MKTLHCGKISQMKIYQSKQCFIDEMDYSDSKSLKNRQPKSIKNSFLNIGCQLTVIIHEMLVFKLMAIFGH